MYRKRDEDKQERIQLNEEEQPKYAEKMKTESLMEDKK